MPNLFGMSLDKSNIAINYFISTLTTVLQNKNSTKYTLQISKKQELHFSGNTKQITLLNTIFD